jgi:hypothetical protein
MDATDWERQFEENVARERDLMVDLLDASRALTGAFRPAGTSPADAAEYFAARYAAWREVADAITRLAENRLARR